MSKVTEIKNFLGVDFIDEVKHCQRKTLLNKSGFYRGYHCCAGCRENYSKGTAIVMGNDGKLLTIAVPFSSYFNQDAGDSWYNRDEKDDKASVFSALKGFGITPKVLLAVYWKICEDRSEFDQHDYKTVLEMTGGHG